MQSTGTYRGVLERIEAVGTTTMPGFDLKVGGRPLPLSTTFTVIVDGTNGNTYIQPAEALLGARTPIRVTGGIVKAEDRRGRTVDLATTITNGRLEEVLALVVDGTPAMRGRLGVVASLLIPPGPVPVVEKMVLEGRFTLADTTFTSQAMQAKLDELSRRAQGRPGDAALTRVVSAFTGRFRMADGVIRFPALSFDVDGARVDLAGTYAVRGQGLHFDGRIRLAGRRVADAGREEAVAAPALRRRCSAATARRSSRFTSADRWRTRSSAWTCRKRSNAPCCRDDEAQEHRSTGAQEHRNTGTQERRSAGSPGRGPDADGSDQGRGPNAQGRLNSM